MTAQNLTVLRKCGSHQLVCHETNFVDHYEHHLRKEIEKQKTALHIVINIAL